jgi:hypothetical protein
MGVFPSIIGWIFVLMVVPISVWMLFFWWKVGDVTVSESGPGGSQPASRVRPGTWRDLLLFKLLAIVMLAASYLLLDRLIGGQWPTRWEQIAWSIVGGGAGFGFLGLGCYIVVRRKRVVGRARYAAASSDIAGDLISKGPEEAINSRVQLALGRVLARIPFGWLVAAALPALAGAVFLVAVVDVWTDGPPLRLPELPGIAALDSIWSIVIHIVFYVVFGGLILWFLLEAVGEVRAGVSPWGTLGAAAFVTLPLAIYIASEGWWP